MDSLDDKLRPIVEKMWGAGIDYALSPDFKDLSVEEKEALYIRYKSNVGTEVIAQILDVLEQAGYQHVEAPLNPTGWYAKEYNERWGLMTGQEWYDRFKAELTNNYDLRAPNFTSVMAIEAAMKAAGLTKEVEDE